MKDCATCGVQAPDEMKFCSECGAPLLESPIPHEQPEAEKASEDPEWDELVEKYWWIGVGVCVVIGLIALTKAENSGHVTKVIVLLGVPVVGFLRKRFKRDNQSKMEK